MFKVKDRVKWMWLGRPILGVVREKFTHPVSRLIKGKNIKRNGSLEKPAYLVESDAGNLALKLETELSPAPKKRPTPTMFGGD